jgi:putative phage-type endonuclease
MSVELHNVKPRTPEWFALRQPFLTASDIGAVVGVDPFKTPFQVYLEKTGASPAGDNAAMRRGRFFEGAAIEYLKEEFPTVRIIRPNVFVCDRELELGATPDALLEDPDDPGLVNVQIKVVNARSFDLWEGVPPLGYQLQVTAENMLLDAKRGILAVLVISSYDAEIHLFDIPRHAAAEQRIREIAAEFWGNMRAGRRPAPDYGRDAETIAAMFPRAEPGKVLDLTGDNRLDGLLFERSVQKILLGTTAQKIETIDAEIKDKMGDAETGELPGWRITWKNETRRAYSVPEKTNRVLRVKQIDEREQAA